MASATVTSKGQITIPKKVRERLHLGPGDRVEFLIEKGGEVFMRPGKGDIADLTLRLHRRRQQRASAFNMPRSRSIDERVAA